MKTPSSDVADEEQFLFTQADGDGETEEHVLQRKKHSRKKVKEWIAIEEPTSLKPSITGFTNIDGNTRHYVVFHEWNQGKCTNPSRTRR